MLEVKLMPSKGQFIAVWEYDDNIWCITYKWFGGVLKTYNRKDDCWRIVDQETELLQLSNMKFFIKE